MHKIGFFLTEYKGHIWPWYKKRPQRVFWAMSTKIFFPPYITQDRVANNVFDCQNDFHEDQFSFPVNGEK